MLEAKAAARLSASPLDSTPWRHPTILKLELGLNLRDPVVSVRVRTTTLAELEWLKRRLGMNRSNCIRMAVEHYLAAHRLESVAGEQSRLIQELEGWPAPSRFGSTALMRWFACSPGGQSL